METESVMRPCIVITLLLATPIWGVALKPAVAQSGLMTQNDVIVGNGTPGPYSLTWKNITSQTVAISEAGSSLVTAVDYTVDPLQGQVTFSHPLADKAIAVAAYQYDPATAQRTSSQVVLPV